MSILQVQHIEKHFGDTRVLEDISFELEQGQALAIIGSSGSGKTTLLRCLNFLETPDRGRILVRDKVLFDAGDPATQRESEIRKKRLHFGMVFQSFNLFPQYTALEKCHPGQGASGPGAARFQAEQKGDPGGDRGGGARATVQNGAGRAGGTLPPPALRRPAAAGRHRPGPGLSPDILCFDEPTSALDPELTGEVLKVIRGLAEQKTTMIIVTHEMAFARDVADQVIFMDGGIIVEQGDARQVIEHPREERTRQFLSRYEESSVSGQ